MYGSPNAKLLVALTLFVALSLVLQSLLSQYYLFIANQLMMYAVLAIGLDLLVGWSGQFAFAHIAFFGIGVYATTLLRIRWDMPFILAMPLAALGAGVAGFLIAVFAIRLRAVYLALATFAFAECVQWTARTWESMTKGTDGLAIPATSILGYVVDNDARAFPVIAVILALVLAATLYLLHSKFGRSMAAIRESEHVASASGINVKQVKLIAFCLSAVFAGIAGGAYTLFNSFVNPDMLGVQQLVLVLTMLVVGGSGTLPGVLIGVVLIGILPELLRAAPKEFLVWQEFTYGLILILSIMFMPRGIWGALRDRAKQIRLRKKSSVLAKRAAV